MAIPVYIITLYAWHLDFMFQAGVQSELVHGLQHQSFIAISVLVWWSALEPNKRHLRGELWKIGHILPPDWPGCSSAPPNPVGAGRADDRAGEQDAGHGVYGIFSGPLSRYLSRKVRRASHVRSLMVSQPSICVHAVAATG